MSTAYLRGPQPYKAGSDFMLWVKRFETYAQAARIPDSQMAHALLSLLDEAAFRAFDLLGLPSESCGDYKEVVKALTKRFAPATGEPELRFQLSQRSQQAAEPLDDFADALLDLANRAYPDWEADVRMRLARDRFIAGVRADYIQEDLLKTGPTSLEEARKSAKRLEAAREARKQMRASRQTAAVQTIGTPGTASTEETTLPPEVAAVSRQDSLLEMVRKNTEALQQLMQQMQSQPSTRAQPSRMRPARRRTLRCWSCGEPGHIMRQCPSGNEQGSATRVSRRPPAQ